MLVPKKCRVFAELLLTSYCFLARTDLFPGRARGLSVSGNEMHRNLCDLISLRSRIFSRRSGSEI